MVHMTVEADRQGDHQNDLFVKRNAGLQHYEKKGCEEPLGSIDPT
jgi:hypothetical protein